MKTIVIALIILFAITVPLYALDLSVNISQAVYVDSVIESAPMAKIIADFKNLYFWGSIEAPYIAFAGQEACRANTFGAGFGIQQELVKNFNLRLDLGYYITAESIDADSPTFEESQYIHQNKEVFVMPGTKYDHYDYRLDNAPGGSISLEWKQWIGMSSWSWFLNTSYRYLKIKGTSTGWNDTNPYWWDVPKDRDFSAFMGGVGIGYRF